jgi:hypothetical protein
MEMFRHTRDGGASVWLSASEAQMLRMLIVPVMELINGDRQQNDATDAADAGADAAVDDLEKLFDFGEPETPDDPVLARLFPDAYTGDPEAAGEFRKYTERSLREAKKYFAQTVLDTLPENGGRVKLTGDQARDWLRALNDVRLMLGVRLDVSEEFEEQLASLDPEDPKIVAFELYGWLGAVQESLVQALNR